MIKKGLPVRPETKKKKERNTPTNTTFSQTFSFVAMLNSLTTNQLIPNY